jgi:hypothetical protein
MDLKAQLVNYIGHLVDGATILGTVVGTAKAFEWFDDGLSDSSREALTRWLKNMPTDSRFESWAVVFPRLIDRVFGKRALSVKFFFRSFVASTFAVSMVALIANRHLRYAREDTAISLVSVTLLAVVSNFIPDYASLLISRAIVRLMAKKPSPARVAALLLADTGLTTIVALASTLFACIISYVHAIYQFSGSLSSVGSFVEVAKSGVGQMFPDLGWLTFDIRDPYYWIGVFFYGPFFTSVWVWLYVLSAVLIKALNRARFLWGRVLPFLDIDKKPLMAMGKVAGLLAGVSYAALLAVAWFVRQ